ncbi:MAG: membrane dipeptidase [Planctomycetota bacterium]|nr:MAG: membrane dipeptidase [Planctomycetota bacterium]
MAILVLLAVDVAIAADRPTVSLTVEARRVHSAGFVFDGHNDLPWEIRQRAGGSFDRADIAAGVPRFHTDIPRLRAGNVGAQFWAAYVPAETSKENRAFTMTLEQIAIIHAMVKRYPDVFEFAKTADDVVRIQKSGKLASLIGVEGGHSIENSLDKLRRLHELGVGYMTLTHSDTLAWADSATDEAKHGGLTEFGEEVVREMNRLGMLVDLSHVSPDTMRDALRVSKAPIIFSHSSARVVADHPRNVPDDILKLTAKNGGVVMVNFYSGFIHPESARRRSKMFEVSRELHRKFPEEKDYQAARKRWIVANPIESGDIYDVADHIEHIIKVAGIDHVGLGSDFDGIDKAPKQLDDVSKYPVITQVLLDRGYSASQIHQLMSGNILRVMRRSEEVARELATK